MTELILMLGIAGTALWAWVGLKYLFKRDNLTIRGFVKDTQNSIKTVLP